MLYPAVKIKKSMYVYLIDNSIPDIYLLNSCTINHSYSQKLEFSKKQAYTNSEQVFL